MSDNNWLKSLHLERMKRKGGAEQSTSVETSSNLASPTTSLDNGGSKKRKSEVIDLIDDDNEENIFVDAKQRQEQEEADAALARRLFEEDRRVHMQSNAPTSNAASARPEIGGNTFDDGFDKLASLIVFQLASRDDANFALRQLKAQCGGRLTPRNVLKLGTSGLSAILGSKAGKKTNALVDLARKWSTLPSFPAHYNGPSSQADKHFVATLTKSASKGGVVGIGKWTLHTFLEDLGRTDILNTDCYEVQQGVRWYTGADKRSAAAVNAFAKDQNFRPHSMSQVSRIMRTLHRTVQVILSSGGKKRKTPNADDRAKIQLAVAHTRKELEGL